MAQRTVIAILGALFLALIGYLVTTTYLNGVKPAGEWERVAEVYVQEYHRWLSTSPASGWARVEVLATGPEWDRIEKLKPAWQVPSPWEYSSGTYRLVAQFGGEAMVQASYALQKGPEKRPVEEIYLLNNSVRGIRVAQIIAGRSQP